MPLSVVIHCTITYFHLPSLHHPLPKVLPFIHALCTSTSADHPLVTWLSADILFQIHLASLRSADQVAVGPIWPGLRTRSRGNRVSKWEHLWRHSSVCAKPSFECVRSHERSGAIKLRGYTRPSVFTGYKVLTANIYFVIVWSHWRVYILLL